MSAAMDAFMKRARELNCAPDAVDDLLNGRVAGIQSMNNDVITLEDGRTVSMADLLTRRRELP